MSRAAKLTLVGTSVFAVGIVIIVHYSQQWEKSVTLSQSTFHLRLPFSFAYAFQAMHAGVLRDMEQQRIKKERKADFDMQRDLEAEYRKVQHVHDGQSTGAGSGAEGG